MKKVSIVIPCRNEEKFIGKCLDSIIAQDYPKDKLEILVVDGMSEDGTKEVVEEYSQKHQFIKLFDNPKKITPCALNIGIKNAQGDIIIRMDAHAKYENYYIAKCVKYLNEYNVDNVGGVWKIVPRNNTIVGKSIALASSNFFGGGNAHYRTGNFKEPKWVDTVFGGCYKKEIFDKIGYFNENLVRSQDMEFNLRLKKAGYKTLLVPDIIVYYYTRSTLREVFNHRFKDGIWAVVPFKYSTIVPVGLRSLIPLFFVLSLIGSLFLGIFYKPFLYLFFLIIMTYFLTNCYFSAKISISEKNWRYFPILIFTFATLHLSYGFGSMVGLIGVLFSKNFWKMRIKKRNRTEVAESKKQD